MPVWKLKPIVGVSNLSFAEYTGVMAYSPNVSFTSSALVAGGLDGYRYVFSGSNITGKMVSGERIVTGGTLTGLVLKVDGVETMSVSGLNVSAKALFNALEADNPQAVQTLLLAKADKITGTGRNDNLFSLAGDDLLSGGTGNDTLASGSGRDRVYGGSGNDEILGGTGNDKLYGGGANDLIEGGIGDDLINGGIGNDTLLGGDGEDSFVFNTAIGPGNVDRITGFETGDDLILLNTDVFLSFKLPGVLGTAAFHIGIAAADKTDRVIYDPETGRLWFDNDGNESQSKVLFAMLDTGLDLEAFDFRIIDF